MTLAAVIVAALGYAGTAYADLPVQPPITADVSSIDPGAAVAAATEQVDVDVAPVVAAPEVPDGAPTLPAAALEPVARALPTPSLYSPDVPSAGVAPPSQPDAAAPPAPSAPTAPAPAPAPATPASQPPPVNVTPRPDPVAFSGFSLDAPADAPVRPGVPPAPAAPVVSAPTPDSPAVAAPPAIRDVERSPTPPAARRVAPPPVPVAATPTPLSPTTGGPATVAPPARLPFGDIGSAPSSTAAPTGGVGGGLVAALVALLLLVFPRLARLLRTAALPLRQPQLVLLLERPG